MERLGGGASLAGSVLAGALGCFFGQNRRYGEFLLGAVPQWLTAATALGAVIAAGVSIQSQREIARKRAALDFFVKTEMDRHLIEDHDNYTKAIEVMQGFSAAGQSLAAFVSQHSDQYWQIRRYLNVHELMSVGICKNVLDDHVCYAFWSGELISCYRDTMALVQYIQTLPDEAETYFEMAAVARRWSQRPNSAR